MTALPPPQHLVWYTPATGELVDHDPTNDQHRAWYCERGGVLYEPATLTWYGRKVARTLDDALFQLERGRDAPTVLDDVIRELTELRARVLTTDRYTKRPVEDRVRHELNLVTAARDDAGERWAALYGAACAIGTLIAADQLDTADGTNRLLATALAAEWDRAYAERAITDGIDHAVDYMRSVEENNAEAHT